jgi:hypothetical protein
MSVREPTSGSRMSTSWKACSRNWSVMRPTPAPQSAYRRTQPINRVHVPLCRTLDTPVHTIVDGGRALCMRTSYRLLAGGVWRVRRQQSSVGGGDAPSRHTRCATTLHISTPSTATCVPSAVSCSPCAAAAVQKDCAGKGVLCTGGEGGEVTSIRGEAQRATSRTYDE